MSVQRCMRETSSKEFVRWQRHLKKDMNTPTRIDFYLAQVAAEVRRTIAKHPGKIDTDDFILKFVYKNENEAPLTEDMLERRIQNSKAAWFGIAGMTPRKPPHGRKGVQ